MPNSIIKLVFNLILLILKVDSGVVSKFGTGLNLFDPELHLFDPRVCPDIVPRLNPKIMELMPNVMNWS